MSVQFYVVIFVLIFATVSLGSMFITIKVIKDDFSEKIKLDVTAEQMRETEKNIRKFLIKNNINAEGAISKIAKILEVERGGDEKGLQSQAYLKKDNKSGKKIVVFKEGLSEEEKLFAYAHEIAHILNGDGIPVARPNGRNKSQVEQLADYTAAALLMPIDNVYSCLVDNAYADASSRKRTMIIRKLCKEYSVTEIIALRRVKEVYVLKGLND